MSRIAISELNQRVSVQDKTVVRGALGGHEESWSSLIGMPVWAKVHNLSGRELFNAKAVGSSYSVIISVRYRADLRPDMRVLLPGSMIARIESIPFRTAQDTMVDLHCIIIDA